MSVEVLEQKAPTQRELPSIPRHLSEAEFEASRAADRHAAKIISSLLAGIFTIGLVMYTYIWWLVSSD